MTIPRNSNEIQAYLHCGLCLKNNLGQNIEAGWTRQGLQIWCRNHNCNIVHIDFEGVTHPANVTRASAPAEPEVKH
jgi:hypothetical protein